MIVTLLRHYKVNYSWKGSYTPDGYSAAMREYDNADVFDQTIKLNMNYQMVFISNLPRTLSTLKYLKMDGQYIETPLLNEVPMEPFTDKPKEYILAKLNIRARLQWMFNRRRQPETRKRTTERAKEFITKHLTGDMNSLVIGHGFFLRVLSKEMLKHGFKGKRIVYMRNGEQYTYFRDTGRDKSR